MKMRIKKDENVYAFLLLIAVIGVLSACFHAVNALHKLPMYIAYNDVWAFYGKATEPGLPYIDKLIEYPVITGFFIHFMGVLGQNYAGYYFQTSLFLILFATVATYILYQILEKKDEMRLVIYWILAPSMFFFLIYNWDIITVLLVIIAFYTIKQDKIYLASLFLAFGFSSKFYPIIYLLPLLLKKKEIAEWVKIIGVFGVTTLIINLFFMVSNFEGWYYFFSFNSLRPPNPDSIWRVINFFLHYWLSVSQMNMLSLCLFATSSIILMWKFRRESTIKLCFIMTLVFLLFNKILSPQYSLWLLPFFVLLPQLEKRVFYALELSNLIVFFTIIIYYNWHAVSDLYGLITVNYLYICSFFVIIRHFVLIFLLMKTLDANSFLRNFVQKLKENLHSNLN